MSYQPYLVADFRSDSGLNRYGDPWLTPAKAFVELTNMRLFNGVLCKRSGQSIFGQCGHENVAESVGTSGSTNYTHTLSNTTIIRRSVRVYENGGGGQEVVDDGEGSFSGNGTGTIDYDTGDIDVTFDATTTAAVVADYVDDTTSSPIRGIFRFKDENGTEQLVAMDTTRLHLYNTSNNYFFPQDDGASTYANWNSTNLVWAAAEDEKLWLVDFDSSSGIWTWDGADVNKETLTINSSSDTVETALMCFFWEDRILLLNTVENISSTNTPFRQRARWSQRGNSGVWLDDEFGKGGFTDAATNEAIVSARFLGNVLVVFFERSIWRLRYTRNPDLPFEWEQVTNNRAAASTFGSLQFDEYVAEIGTDGLFGTNTQTAFNIDSKIPQYVNNQFNNDAIARAYSIRDDHLKHGLIAYPSVDEDATTNDRFLVIHYEEGTFSTYEQSALCFGEWSTAQDITFQDLSGTVQDNINTLWGDGQLQSGFPIILSGASDGYVYFIQDETASQDATTWDGDPENFNLGFLSAQLNPFKEKGIQCSLSFIEFLVNRQDGQKFQVDVMVDYDTEVVVSQEIDCSGEGDAQDKTWVMMSTSVSGDAVQIRGYLTESQLADSQAGQSQVEIYGYRFWFQPAGRMTRW